MISIIGNSGHVAYGIKEFLCDSPVEIDLLPIDIAPGSTAIVIEDGKGIRAFILNNNHEWKEV